MAVARHPAARIAPPAPAIISASRAYLLAPTARAPSLSEKEIGAGTRRRRFARRTSARARRLRFRYAQRYCRQNLRLLIRISQFAALVSDPTGALVLANERQYFVSRQPLKRLCSYGKRRFVEAACAAAGVV